VDRRFRPLYKPPARLGLWALEYAQVAQLVEHATENRSVGGSIPPLGTISFEASSHQLISLPAQEAAEGPQCGAKRQENEMHQ
jgi:hypothetical protein